MTAGRLFSLSVEPAARALRRFWLSRVEQHYLISAEVEAAKARQANANAAYFQKKAALARSARLSD
ncbi:MAG TPA: hypothetical protein VJ652_14960 [Noviherbaspirillum sp.]|nr:hypothetical protein [Noviherbaspirillum sp.]